MAIHGYTKNYKLIKPQFDTDTWHDYVYDNLDTIDAVLSAIFASGDWQGFWKSNTHYNVGGVVIDRATDTMYKVMVEHTTSEATFAEEFAAHPTYYELWSPNNLAEDWAIKMDGQVSNTDYSSKAYAISSGLIDDGSAKEWAVGTGTIGDTGEYSAKKYATDAHNDYISMTTDVNVVAVGSNIASVNAVAGISSAVSTVANKIAEVDTVAWISNDVTTVAGIATAVTNVSNIESSVLDVSDNRTDISTVASNISDVNTVAGVSTAVSTVAANDANVTTVATNISDVNTAATNMTAIQNAPTAASNAAASATLAQDWATKMDGQVASTDYSSKYYAGQAATSATAAQDALESVHGLIATPIGTIFQSIYVDESLDLARMLNGQLISSTKFYGLRQWLTTVQTAIPNLFTDEATWQAEKLLSKFGQVGKFVIDDDANTIRLPAVVNPQGLLGLSGIGNLVNESLPNIKESVPSSIMGDFGSTVGSGRVFEKGGTTTYKYASGSYGTNSGFDFDVSRKYPVYQDDAPVQQEAIQYPYYIQVATGVEETLPAIREYEINTPFFFGQSQYSGNAPYNASWLASNGQYNASGLYPDFWTQLTGVELNSSLNVGDTIEISGKTYVKRGLPVVLSTGTITDYDFVVNQNDQTFRLPLLNGEEDLRGNVLNALTVPANGSIYTATKNCYLCLRGGTTSTNSYVYLCILDNGIYKEGYINHCNAGTGNGINTELFVKRGQEVKVGYSNTNLMYFSEVPAVGNGTLYYYVGDTVQDASLINAGAVLGQLSNKADIDASNFNAAGRSYLSGIGMPTTTYDALTLGASGSTYTAPANGYFYLNKIAGSDFYYTQIATIKNGSEFRKIFVSEYRASPCTFLYPVRRGDVVQITYNATGTTQAFRFYYAEGEV